MTSRPGSGHWAKVRANAYATRLDRHRPDYAENGTQAYNFRSHVAASRGHGAADEDRHGSKAEFGGDAGSESTLVCATTATEMIIKAWFMAGMMAAIASTARHSSVPG
jgi:hypothetical protein